MIETSKNMYIIMELVHGGNLRDLILARVNENHSFTDLEASTLMKNILKAVKYFHMKNITIIPTR